ncbi:hypothetical protein D3C71_1343960 [compost metagenome]
MEGPIGFIIGIVVGVGFTCGVSFSNIQPDQINQAVTLCTPNGGMATLRSNMWNERTVICINGAKFVNFGEK